MAGVVTGSTGTKDFYDVKSLPTVKYTLTLPDGTICDVVVVFQGHHVIPKGVFADPLFQALKRRGLALKDTERYERYGTQHLIPPERYGDTILNSGFWGHNT